MPEECPECGAASLFYEPKQDVAKCSISSCGYSEEVEDEEEYEERFRAGDHFYLNAIPTIPPLTWPYEKEELEEKFGEEYGGQAVAINSDEEVLMSADNKKELLEKATQRAKEEGNIDLWNSYGRAIKQDIPEV